MNQQKLSSCTRSSSSVPCCIGIVIGAIMLAVGICYLVISYGLLIGKGWTWVVTVSHNDYHSNSNDNSYIVTTQRSN